MKSRGVYLNGDIVSIDSRELASFFHEMKIVSVINVVKRAAQKGGKVDKTGTRSFCAQMDSFVFCRKPGCSPKWFIHSPVQKGTLW